jgi:hypothetical protein
MAEKAEKGWHREGLNLSPLGERFFVVIIAR